MSAAPPNADRLFFDLSARVKLRVTGPDRIRFLNGQVSNDIRKATETAAVEACVLNAKGKMDAHLFAHAEGDAFLIDADPALQPILQPRLERYIIADDVQIEDVTSNFSIFHLLGEAPSKSELDYRVVAVDRFGAPGHDIWSVAGFHDRVRDLLSAAAKYCDENCAELFRIQHGIPKWGRELTSEIIPVEANLEQRCIDYEKGCYIGQETISRMKMSGQRNKSLCGVVSLTGGTLDPEMRLIGGSENKDAGWITSVTATVDRQIALGYVKRPFNNVGTHLKALSGDNRQVDVQVVEIPFLSAR